MKKIAFIICTMFLFVNVLTPTTVSFALDNIQDLITEDNVIEGNDIIVENEEETDKIEDDKDIEDDIIIEDIWENQGNKEDESLDDSRENTKENEVSDILEEVITEETEKSEDVEKVTEEELKDESPEGLYEKVKKTPEELDDSNVAIATFSIGNDEINSNSEDTSLYIPAEEVEYYVESNNGSITLVAEYSSDIESETVTTEIYNEDLLEELQQDEFKEIYENALNYEYLVKKTDANYEIVMAYSNGDFSYLDTADTIEEAIEKTSNDYGQDNVELIPCVVDNSGVVVYSTNSMARFFKHTNGSIDNSQVTYLYQYSDLSGVSNYVNHNYVDDAPIIEDNGNAVRVMVNGYRGWTKKDTATGTYDVVVVPMNQVKNPSYYSVSNGQLMHFISTDVTSTTAKGNTRTVGVAPSYLREGTKYYSYDAQYFYTSLDTLISDLKNNTNNNAINSTNTYYNYYQYLPFRSKSIYTAAELNNFIDNNAPANSKLRGIGQYLINAQEKYGVNAAIILGVAINESAWGTSNYALNRNNLFGLNAVDSNPDNAYQFSSVEQCINEFANYYISKGYSDPQDYRYYGGFVGNKYLGANVKYASDPFWGEKAASYVFNIDRYLSGNDINNLSDYNYNQLAVYSAAGQVLKSNGSVLYNISSGFDYNSTYIGVPVVLTSSVKYSSGSKSYYELNPERTSELPVSGGTEFGGVYDWNTKGYIDASKVKLINTSTQVSTGIKYQAYVQDIGWQDSVYNGTTAGTNNQSKRVEALRISLVNYPSASVSYRVHVEEYGWMNWVSDGQMAGTTDESKRIEAVEIKSNGLPTGMHIEYRVHVQDYGWMDWKSEGEMAGTTNEKKRVEAIEIRIVAENGSVQYQTHVQDIGWQGYYYDGKTAGTTNQKKRIEALNIRLVDYGDASITYRTHVQDYGWMNWASDGQVSGTIGEGKRVEALQIKSSGLPDGYYVQYRVHVEEYGWMDWKSEGETAGTIGEAKRIEAIEVRVVQGEVTVKYQAHVQEDGWQNWVYNGALAGTSNQAKRLEAIKIEALGLPSGAGIRYQTHVQDIGWQGWVSNGAMAGTSDQKKRLEAIKIELTNAPSNYEVMYRVHVQDIGWQNWVSNGTMAGTNNQAKRMEAIEIKILKLKK